MRSPVKSAYSRWHQIYYDFRSTLDPAGYLDDCRELLQHDWRYGLFLIEHLATRGKYTEADGVAERTAASLAKSPFEPERSLLISTSNAIVSHTSLRENVTRLLKDWLTIADKLKRKERAASLRFQLVTCETPEDWDEVVGCLRRLSGPRAAQTVARLVEQWRDYILRAQLGLGCGEPVERRRLPADVAAGSGSG